MVKLWDFETSKLNKIKKQFSKYLIAEGNVLLLAKAGVPGLLCNGRIGFI